MAAAIRDRHPGADVELIPGGRGDFTVCAGGREVWNKQRRGGFPDETTLAGEIAALADEAGAPS